MTDEVYHCITRDETAERLGTHIENGLSTEEVKKRIREHGYNELTERPRPGFLNMLLRQFNNFLVIILILAALVSLVLGEYVDAIAIMVIVVINAMVGVIQESKAEQSLAALKKMAAPNAQVIRDGRMQTIPSRELVPGDIVSIEAGNYVPADIRLVEGHNLKVGEASLTGESMPVEKEAAVVLDKEIPLGDRKNSAFMSTLVTYGRGRGIVTGTGMHTQIGLIADMLQTYEEEPTPLQNKLDQLAKTLGVGCLSICGIIFVWGLIRDTHLGMIFRDGFPVYFLAEQKDIINLFMTAVSLAIAAVPEGLPAVVTICLALGMQKMLRRHALIRKLSAVETLGCTTVICSDKTGTLTQNEMTVVQVWAGGNLFKVSGEGYVPEGQFFTNDQPVDPLKDVGVALLLHGAVLCNDAKLENVGGEIGAKAWRMIGDPTEGAMVVVAAKGGLQRHQLEVLLPRICEIPFDSERKRMTTRHEPMEKNTLNIDSGIGDSPVVAFVKGAPEILLQLCDHIVEDGKAVLLDEKRKQAVLEINRNMAGQALRVLGVAFRPMATVPEACNADIVEQKLTFVGLMGMIDPPRQEVMEAVRIARGAGLKSVMVTGDYKETAEAVARNIGLLTPQGKVLTGAELDAMSAEEISSVIEHVDVFCRVSPQHKTTIVEAFKAKGHVVAMTGDGVNDAPALKLANIGVAMGITGTDVAKETADMVLTDDNYASIISAVEEGRIIYSNIRKFVYYLLICNVGEILIVFFAMLLGMPIPLSPIMLLWLNLVTDGAPALALGMEKGDPDIMKQPPRPAKEPVINREMMAGLLVIPLVSAMTMLFVFSIGLTRHPESPAIAQTMVFVSLCLSELLRAYTSRSEHHSILTIGVFSNRWMNLAVLSSVLLILIPVYVPFLSPIFGTGFLGLVDWFMMIPFIFMSPAAAELVKIYLRKASGNAKKQRV
ncbi:MAG: cation-translocating P-type ATPase [Nitrospiraceae bacterium]|nr:cation-translocating P-type ATPase [Nitrospiraceae bacterium]